MTATKEEIGILKDAIGWSWVELGQRIGWSPPHLHKFRMGKLEFPEEWVPRIQALAYLVPQVMDGTPPDKPYLVILTEALAGEYRAADNNPEMSHDERAGALWMIGRLASVLQVDEDVRDRLRHASEAITGESV